MSQIKPKRGFNYVTTVFQSRDRAEPWLLKRGGRRKNIPFLLVDGTERSLACLVLQIAPYTLEAELLSRLQGLYFNFLLK